MYDRFIGKFMENLAVNFNFISSNSLSRSSLVQYRVFSEDSLAGIVSSGDRDVSLVQELKDPSLSAGGSSSVGTHALYLF